MEQGHYVQIGTHTMLYGSGELRLPLFMRVSDGKAYYAKRDKCISGISRMVIEKYRDRLQTTTEGESYVN
jgi:hypothetical protein